jgi:hypothetical protein
MTTSSGAAHGARRDRTVHEDVLIRIASRHADIVPGKSDPHVFPLKHERESRTSQDMRPTHRAIALASHFPWLP